MATTMVRLDLTTRDRLTQVAGDDFGGVTADEAVRRLLDEHWERRAIEAMETYRREDPAGWNEYLREADDLDSLAATPTDPWDTAA
jgi:hypothetical protein